MFDPPPERIVLATANAGKHAELVALLGGHVDVIARPPEIGEVIEDAGTLVGNARLKARAIMSATGEVALADDTGLEVDALDGRPGVDSSSFGGVDHDDARNIDRLLRELRDVPGPERTARFRTVLVLVAPDGRELVTEGVVEGTIAIGRSGVDGFGYDPVFVPDEGDGRTFADMTRAQKSAISHRGRALRALVVALGR
ncbi:MAG: RdgB/HAM1 family non-canonical purine NTP pyrophosphatase [Actinobacteria bacterium]|nr:RdgB/HAM1 family non-canonical purine NTP pyrophosphatase [Actinomycetota bacterium]